MKVAETFEFEACTTFDSLSAPVLMLDTFGCALELEVEAEPVVDGVVPVVITKPPPPGMNGLTNCQKIASTPLDCNLIDTELVWACATAVDLTWTASPTTRTAKMAASFMAISIGSNWH